MLNNRPFPLDEFQSRSCEILENGNNLLVAAHTSAGKVNTKSSKQKQNKHSTSKIMEFYMKICLLDGGC
jgi:hypothetical protein